MDSFVYVPGATLAITADAPIWMAIITNVPILGRTNQSRGKSFPALDGLWTNSVAGSHVLTAIAVDNTGATTLSLQF